MSRDAEFMHRPAWSRARLHAGEAPSGTWLVFADRVGAGAELAAALADAGAEPFLVRAGERLEIAERGATVDPAEPGHVRGLLDALAARGRWPRGIVHAWSCDAAPLAEASDASVELAVAQGPMALVHLVTAVAKGQAPTPRLCVLTRGAQAVEPGRVAVLQAPTLGVARVTMFEHPDLEPLLIDLPSRPAEGDAARVAALVTQRGPEELALRGERVLAHRLRPMEVELRDRVQVRGDGAYLVTGGLGGLGFAAAEWLAGAGAGAVVLLVRRDRPDRADDLARLASEADVEVVVADVADDAQVRAAVARASAKHPLRGVLHTAAALDDVMLAETDAQRFGTVFRPKAIGALRLDRATAGLDLDFLGLYSSGAALIGYEGQASYAAANAFLDALALDRVARGEAATSVNWGGCSDAGAAAARGWMPRYHGFGLLSFTAAEGLEALARMLAQRDRGQVAFLGANWQRYVDIVWLGSCPPMLRELAR